ncbi:(Fe-S)-binding protein [Streptomyces sp. NEAU-H3]|nr:(Fe-S)-binding protein [Streptomyces sp. NEAU-H3]NJA57740.1 (Fe-S)-binding protein [Streptomyces sp. NEAU-H3]
MRIGLFATCLGDTMFPDAVSATAVLLTRLGHEVVFPPEKPLRLLRAVEDLDLVELPEADACCGFGGTFAVKNADTSSAMLQDKVGNVTATGADVCTAGDSSCLLHIGGGLSRVRAGTRPLHLAQILASTRTTPYVLPGVPPTARATPTSPRASTTPAATTPEVTR